MTPEIYNASLQLTVNVPPVVKWIGYIQFGEISIDAIFDLSCLHPSQHELAIRIIGTGRIKTYNPWKAPGEILLSKPWWKFWK